MPTAFPTSIDSFTDPSAGDRLNNPAVLHASQHDQLNDAVTAIETKLGYAASSPILHSVLAGSAAGQTTYQTHPTLVGLTLNGDGLTVTTGGVAIASGGLALNGGDAVLAVGVGLWFGTTAGVKLSYVGGAVSVAGGLVVNDPNGYLRVQVNESDGSPQSIIDIAFFERTTTSSADDGIGGRTTYRLEDSDGNLIDAVYTDWVFDAAAAGLISASWRVQTRESNIMAQRMMIKAGIIVGTGTTDPGAGALTALTLIATSTAALAGATVTGQPAWASAQTFPGVTSSASFIATTSASSGATSVAVRMLAPNNVSGRRAWEVITTGATGSWELRGLSDDLSASNPALVIPKTGGGTSTAPTIGAWDFYGQEFDFHAGIVVLSGGIDVTGGITGTISTASQPNITSVGILAAPHMTSPVVDSGGVAVMGNSTITGTLGGVTTLTATTLAGTLSTAAQPNITSVGTLTSLTSSGAITTTGNITATGNGGLSAGGGAVLSGNAYSTGYGTQTGNVNSTVTVQAGTNGGANTNSADIRFVRSQTLVGQIGFFNAGSATVAGRSNVNTDFCVCVTGFSTPTTLWDSSGNLYQQGTLAISAGITQQSGILTLGATASRSTTDPTNAINVFNGTAPVGTLTNGATFYAASGEMRVMDSAGNSTLLSPHDDAGNWVYDSRSPITGKHLRVEMERLVKALDAMLGGGYVHEAAL